MFTNLWIHTLTFFFLFKNSVFGPNEWLIRDQSYRLLVGSLIKGGTRFHMNWLQEFVSKGIWTYDLICKPINRDQTSSCCYYASTWIWLISKIDLITWMWSPNIQWRMESTSFVLFCFVLFCFFFWGGGWGGYVFGK